MWFPKIQTPVYPLRRAQHALNVLLLLIAPLATPLAQAPVSTPSQSMPRRVWADTNLYLGLSAPSPDGRLVSNTDLFIGNIMVRDLESGRMRSVTDQTLEHPTGFGLESVFSPDGRQIAYSWSDFASRGNQLRIVPADSGTPRIIWQAPNGASSAYPSAMDWTHDGAYVVAVVQQPDKTSQIVFVPTTGGPARVIRSFADWRQPDAVRVSPDGDHIAYSFPPSKVDGRRDIYLLSLHNNRETTIARNPADEGVLGWSQNGSNLLFSSERNGSPGVWSVSISDGKQVGEPKLIRKDLWRTTPLRSTTSGAVFYIVQAGDADLYVAPLDGTSGRLTAAPVSVSQSAGTRIASPAWSSDGRFLAYLSWTGDNARVGSTKLVVRSMETGESRAFSPAVAYLRRIRWMPDGHALLLDGGDDSGARAAMRLDLRTGTIAALVSGTNAAVISRDGKTLFYVPKGKGSLGRTIVARDVATAKERVVYAAAAPEGISVAYARYEPNLLLTRDGGSLVFALRPNPDSGAAQVMIVPVQGGPARVIAAPPPEWNFTNVRFVGQLPNGDAVFTTARDLRTPMLERATVWRASLNGNHYEQIEMPRMARSNSENCECSLSISPDGRRVAFTDGRSAEELWMFRPAGDAQSSIGRR